MRQGIVGHAPVTGAQRKGKRHAPGPSSAAFVAKLKAPAAVMADHAILLGDKETAGAKAGQAAIAPAQCPLKGGDAVIDHIGKIRQARGKAIRRTGKPPASKPGADAGILQIGQIKPRRGQSSTQCQPDRGLCPSWVGDDIGGATRGLMHRAAIDRKRHPAARATPVDPDVDAPVHTASLCHGSVE